MDRADHLARIGVIRSKLAGLPGLQPRASRSRSQLRLVPGPLRPPLSEQTVRELERVLELVLPEPYRLFVTCLGNGGWGPTYYPMNPLALAMGPVSLARPFPARGTGIHRRRPQPHEDHRELNVDWLRGWGLRDEDLREVIHDDVEGGWMHGCLELGTDGCGLDHLLVLTGEARGEVWLDSDEGLFRQAPSFFDWYERALDREIDERRERAHHDEAIDVRVRHAFEAGTAEETFDCAKAICWTDTERAEALFALALQRSSPQGIARSLWHLDWIMTFLVRIGNDTGAVELGTRALRDGIVTAEELKNPLGWSRLGRAYMHLGDEPNAIAWLTEPGDDGGGGENPSLNRAQILLWAGRYSDALVVIDALRRCCLEYDDDDRYSVEAELLRGAALAGLRGDDGAMRGLRDTYEHDDHWTANAADAVLSYTRQRQDFAQRILRRGRRWTTVDVAQAFARVDDRNLLAQERDLAFAQGDDVLRDIPDCPSVRYALAIAHRDLGAHDRALACLDRVLDDSGYKHDLIASVLIERGQPERAVTHGEIAVARRPGCIRVRDNLGYYLARAGDPARAESVHAEVIAHEPAYTWAHVNMACALALQGRLGDALGCLRDALDRGHDPWRVAADPALDSLKHLDEYSELMNDPG